MIFDLIQDFGTVLDAMPPGHPRQRILSLLAEAVRRDVHFINRHPTTLFQCLWNSCWWYDCPEAEKHYEVQENGRPQEDVLEPRLSALLEGWRHQKEDARPGSVWLRSLRPPPIPLGGPLRALFTGHGAAIRSLVLSTDGNRLASASADGTVRVWETATQREVGCLQGHAGAVRQAVLAPDGQRVLSWSADETVRLWDVGAGVPLACLGGSGAEARYLHLSANTGLAALVPENGALLTWQLLRGVPGCSIEAPENGSNGIVVSDVGDLLAVASGSVIRLHETASGDILTCLEGHEDTITCLAFSPRGNRLVSGSDDRTVRIWDVEEGREVICLRGHRSAVLAVAYSAAGDYIASGSEGEVHVWEEDYDADLFDFQDHDEEVTALAFVPKTALLITGSATGTIRMYNLLAFSRIAEGQPLGGAVTACAVSPDGRLFVCGADDGSWGVWTVEKGDRLLLFVPRPLAEIEPFALAGRTIRPASGSAIRHVSFSPDGRHFWVGFGDSQVQRWDVTEVVEYAEAIQTGTEGNPSISARFGVIPLTMPRPEPVRYPTRADDFREVLLSPDASTFVSASLAAALRVWEGTTGKALACLSDLPGSPSTLAFAPDGQWLAARLPGRLRPLVAEPGRLAARFPTGAPGPGSAPDVFPRRHSPALPGGGRAALPQEDRHRRASPLLGGRCRCHHPRRLGARSALLALLQEDGSLLVGNWQTNEILARITGEDGFADILLPAGGRSIVARRGHDILAWDLASSRPPSHLQGHTERVTCLVCKPDGSGLLSGSEDATVRLWDLAASSPMRHLRGSASRSRCLAVSPDGGWVATAHQSDILLWSGNSGELAAVLEGHADNVRCVVFSRDGNRLASGSNDETIRVWDLASGSSTVVLEGHEGPVLGLAFAPDGSRLVSGPGSRESTVRLWDIDRGDLVRTFEGHRGEVLGVDVSPDGRLIVSGSDDQTVRVWEVDSGREIVCFRVSEMFVDVVAFMADGRRVVSGLSDEVVRVWNISSGECLEVHEGHGDVRALADARPWLGLVQPTTTVITSVATGNVTAWFAGALELLGTDVSGRVWGGFMGGHLCLLRLEGADVAGNGEEGENDE